MTTPRYRGPNRIMSAKSLRDRLRRMRAADHEAIAQAKRLVKEGEDIEAIQTLVEADIWSKAHLEAYLRWVEAKLLYGKEALA